MKIYKCIICNKVLEEKPIRLVKQIYGAGRYNQYHPIEHFDFCKKHFERFMNWINNHRRENERQEETHL